MVIQEFIKLSQDSASVMTTLGCQLSNILVNYNPEMEGTPVTSFAWFKVDESMSSMEAGSTLKQEDTHL